MSKTIDISVENNGTEVIIVSLERVGVEARVGNVERSITVDFGSLPQNIYWDEIQDKPNFHAVATSGDYNDLENTPNLHPVATSGNYNDLTNKPDLKPVATSGDYDDLSDKPQINGVTLQGNKTTANLGLATASQGALADTAYQKPQDGIPKSDLSSGVQASLNKADTALQEHQSLAGYATQSWVEDQGYLTEHQDISGKQDTLTFDGTPTANSDNPVTSGGIAAAIANFITVSVNNLVNYYTKSETYTKSEVTDLIAALHAARFERVNTLPVTGETNVIYLVPAPQQQSGNIYNEYIYINNGWELIGNTSIDLSNYYNKSQVDSKIAALHTAESIGFSYPPFNINTANAENSYVYGADGKLYLLPIGHVAGVSWDSTQKQLVDILNELGGKASSGQAVPPGGTTGQVLAKKSDDDNDVEWIDPPEGGGTGDYEELENKPSINGVTLEGDLETEDLNIEALTNEEIDQLLV